MAQPPGALQGLFVGSSPLLLSGEEQTGSHIISPGQEPKPEFSVWLLLDVLLLWFIMLKSNRNEGLYLELRNWERAWLRDHGVLALKPPFWGQPQRVSFELFSEQSGQTPGAGEKLTCRKGTRALEHAGEPES